MNDQRKRFLFRYCTNQIIYYTFHLEQAFDKIMKGNFFLGGGGVLEIEKKEIDFADSK